MNKKNIVALILLSIVWVMCVENHVLPNFGIISITSDPEGAEIYKDGESTGTFTPNNFNELLSGNYSFALKLNNFIDTTFSIEVSGGSDYSENIFLNEVNPKGEISLTSIPSGANIFLDEKDTGKKTPATFDNLQRGIYNFSLKLNLYELQSVSINLTRDETIARSTNLVIVGSAGSLFITSNPVGASIILDGNETGLVTPDTLIPISSGSHQIKLSLTDHRDTTITTSVIAGSLVEESVELTFYEPRGSITIDSSPQGAKIFSNNTNTGLVTPNTIKKVTAGNYNIKLQLNDYNDTSFTVSVTEDLNTNAGVINLVKTPIYKISALSNPTGASNISGTGEFKEGEQVTLVTTANSGYKFIHWTEGTDEVSTNISYSFTVTKDRSLIANYDLVGTLIVKSDPAGASIFLNGTATNKVTPFTFTNIKAEQYTVELKLEDFADTSKIVLVNRNQTTNTGTIFLTDITPPVKVAVDYKVDSDALFFLYSFNQDVKVTQIILTKPNGDSTPPDNGVKIIKKGTVIELRYPEKITGIWKLSFKGNKVVGRNATFNISISKLVN
ncbi:MAG: PEGA domain-containing protein [Melioribacteraceae bacterium]